MIALCVDDELPLLDNLVRVTEASPDISKAVPFSLCSQALEWAKNNKPDIAFLDIKMRGMGGLELAQQLKMLYPELPIIFCTGYRDYAFDAIQIRASGYIMKPVSPEAVQKEIDAAKVTIKNEHEPKKLLTAQCFGNFDVFANGKPLHFKRKRSKELIAYLIDRRGSTVTTRELCAVLWEDFGDDQKNMAHLYKLFEDLRKTLASEGAEAVLIKNNQEYSVNTQLIDCDYYKYLENDASAQKKFAGEYMLQYPWAEETTAALYNN